jgi:hypothetical protein
MRILFILTALLAATFSSEAAERWTTTLPASTLLCRRVPFAGPIATQDAAPIVDEFVKDALKFASTIGNLFAADIDVKLDKAANGVPTGTIKLCAPVVQDQKAEADFSVESAPAAAARVGYCDAEDANCVQDILLALGRSADDPHAYLVRSVPVAADLAKPATGATAEWRSAIDALFASTFSIQRVDAVDPNAISLDETDKQLSGVKGAARQLFVPQNFHAAAGAERLPDTAALAIAPVGKAILVMMTQTEQAADN